MHSIFLLSPPFNNRENLGFCCPCAIRARYTHTRTDDKIMCVMMMINRFGLFLWFKREPSTKKKINNQRPVHDPLTVCVFRRAGNGGRCRRRRCQGGPCVFSALRSSIGVHNTPCACVPETLMMQWSAASDKWSLFCLLLYTTTRAKKKYIKTAEREVGIM